MPICSYLIHARRGTRDDLAEALGEPSGCEVHAAEDEDLLILVTDTPDEQADERLRRALEQREDIECMALTFGSVEPESIEAAV